MTQLMAIARRETGAFFHSAMAPVVIGGFLVLTGLFFTLFTLGYSEMSLNAIKSGRADPNLNLTEGVFQPLVADMTVFLLFLLPAVSMRLFSEEYRSGRYDLVMSYPVADQVWVLGKFLSVMAVTMVLILSSGAYFAVAAWLGHPEIGPVAAAILGLLLLAGTIAAWGVFFSTLFQYQLISYFLTFATVLVFYALGSLEPHLPPSLGRWTMELSLSEHVFRFSRGVVDSRDVLFLLGCTLLGLFAATASVAGRRMALRRRWTRWLPTLVLTVLLVLLYAISLRHPVTLDWTRNQRYSLAPQTVQVLRALDQEVEVYAFYQRLDPERKAVEVLLRASRDHTPYLKFQMVDPDRDLDLVQDFGVTKARSVVVQVGERQAELLAPNEMAFVNTVFRLATGSQPVVYHVMGHGEHRIDSSERGGYATYAELLAAQGYELRVLLLPQTAEVPADADIVVLAGPKLDFNQAELMALDRFLQAGGAILCLVDPVTPDSLSAWTQRYNVQLGGDLLVGSSDGRQQFGVDQRVVVVYENYPEHAVTRGLKGLPTLFPFTQTLSSLRSTQEGLTGTAILYSEPGSWATWDRSNWASGRLRFEEGVDKLGPLAFGAALELARETVPASQPVSQGPRVAKEMTTDDPVLQSWQKFHPEADAGPRPSVFTEPETSRLIFVGDSDFAVNENLNLYGNRDLLLNMFGWLERQRVLIALRPRVAAGEPVVLTVTQQELIGWGSILVWPLLACSASLAWVVRHRKRR